MLYIILLLLAVISCIFKIQILTNGSEVIIELSDKFKINFLLEAVILAPILEEIFFRKLLLGHLKKYLPWWSAIGLSSLLFASFHKEAVQQALVLPLGLTLGFVFWKTGKLRYSIFLHFMNNLFVYLTIVYQKFFFTTEIVMIIYSKTLAVLGTVICMYFLIAFLNKKYPTDYCQRNI